MLRTQSPLLVAALLLLISLPTLADAHVDCDGNGTIDLVCEGSLCQHQDGALGYCSCAVTPNGPGPVKSCTAAPVLAELAPWQETQGQETDAEACFTPAISDQTRAIEADETRLSSQEQVASPGRSA